MLRTIRFFLSSRKSWTIPYVIFSAVFVILPLLLIVVYAFMDDAGHFTLGNFAKFFAHPEAINTFVYSIGVAIITTVVCILLGYPAAYILTQTHEFHSRGDQLLPSVQGTCSADARDRAVRPQRRQFRRRNPQGGCA